MLLSLQVSITIQISRNVTEKKKEIEKTHIYQKRMVAYKKYEKFEKIYDQNLLEERLAENGLGADEREKEKREMSVRERLVCAETNKDLDDETQTIQSPH